MSRENLEQMWREHRNATFPPIGDADLKADLAEYDGHLAGLISRVLGRDRELPTPITLDHGLAERVRRSASKEAADYVDRLHRAAALAREVHESDA